ncbi:MAG TPA: alpha/beta fold hydrolase [Vicinamibacterales bacterium]|nr:alpha/beta fold hydrolase [Vicinamibacterales bacterium]
MFWRALVAFIALPGMVAFAVPLLIAGRRLVEGPFSAIGLLPLLAGIGLLFWCIRDFYVVGQGTLAHWQPPKRLVTANFYRFSRNPMYVAVTLILLGWAIVFRSWGLLLYALCVRVAFHLHVVLVEEPWLLQAHASEWKRYKATVPRWLFRSRRALLLTCLGVAVALPIAGLIYETIAEARASSEFPPPGTMVDVGGRRLHLICIGEGTPTVIFESSGFGSALSSVAARQRLAARTTVCSYDRRGRGWSDPAPGATTVGDLARDLGVLQDRAKLKWPFVLVASSIGGLTAEMFARQYPERVAGLVYLDAANSIFVPRLASYAGLITVAACGMGALAQVGVVRLLDPFAIGADSDNARRGAAITYSAKAWSSMCAMARGLRTTRQEFEQAPPLRADLPVTALSASSAVELAPPAVLRFIDADAIMAETEKAHREIVQRSTRGTWKKVPDSTHLIASSQPEAVVEAVVDLLEQLER